MCNKTPPRLSGACVHVARARTLYARYDATGLQYGPSFRRLAELWTARGRGVAVATLLRRTALGALGVHPADIDCPQHLGLLLSSPATPTSGPQLPFAYDKVSIRPADGSLSSVCLCPAGAPPCPARSPECPPSPRCMPRLTCVTVERPSGSVAIWPARNEPPHLRPSRACAGARRWP